MQTYKMSVKIVMINLSSWNERNAQMKKQKDKKPFLGNSIKTFWFEKNNEPREEQRHNKSSSSITTNNDKNDYQAQNLARQKVIQQASLGDQKAVSSLIHFLTPVIQASVAHLLTRFQSAHKNKNIATEVADYCQEILLLLFKNNAKTLLGWEPEKGMSLTSFVSLIAKRRVISDLRHAKLHLSLDDKSVKHSLKNHITQGDIASQLSDRQLVYQVVTHLKNDISELGFDIFTQLFLFENTPEEISQNIGISVNAIYVWKNRIKKQAQLILKKIDKNTFKATYISLSELTKKGFH